MIRSCQGRTASLRSQGRHVVRAGDPASVLGGRGRWGAL